MEGQKEPLRQKSADSPPHPQIWSCPEPLHARQHMALPPANLLFISVWLIHSGLVGRGGFQTRFPPHAHLPWFQASPWGGR